jgi:two-component sensor histidine kinase
MPKGNGLTPWQGTFGETDEVGTELARLRSENLELRGEVARLEAASRREKELVRELEATAERQRASLERSEALLREEGHRVRNWLQAIDSMLRIQAIGYRDPAVRDALRMAGVRIEAIAELHSLLRAGRGTGAVPDFAACAGALCACLGRALGADGGCSGVEAEVEVVRMPPEDAEVLALALVELVIDAFRHAPAAGLGAVSVRGAHGPGGAYSLSVADGRSRTRDALPPGEDGGMHAILALMVQQLGAELDLHGPGGARLTITVPASRLG